MSTTRKLLDKGIRLAEAGDLAEASSILQQACQTEPDNARAWLACGSINVRLGKYDKALKDLSRAIELDPNLAEAHYQLATIHRNTNRLEQARMHAEKSMALKPDYSKAVQLAVSIYGLLGSNHAQLKDIGKSAAAYRRLLELKPDSEEACYGLGYAHYQQGKHGEAAAFLERALELNKAYVDAAMGLGTVYQALGKSEAAAATFQKALDIKPDTAEALFGKARAFVELSKQPEALALLQKAIEIRPDYIDARLNLASILMTFDQPQEALKHCNRALETQPGNIDATVLLARIELQSGQAESAHEHLRPHIASGTPHVNLHVTYGDICKSLNRTDDAIDGLESLLGERYNIPVTSRRNVHFCLGKLYDKSGDYDKAFHHFHAGNELRAVTWDPGYNSASVDAIIRVFSTDFLASAPRASIHSEKPVFIVGMPRSGSSLVEQVLASHPAVHGAGELPYLLRMAHELPNVMGTDVKFPDCVASLQGNFIDRLAQGYLAYLETLAPHARRVTDKMPGNFSFIGLIEMLFPNARIIHCIRNPVDTCLSCYLQDFAMSQNYSYDLTNLGLFHREYSRLMAHWKAVSGIPVMEVHYEEMVDNQEAISRELVNFCGLDWDDSCLQFHQTERYVATSSYDQVRRPIYSSSVRRWKNYERHLGPLIKALGKV